MKASLIFAIIMLTAIFAFGQNPSQDDKVNSEPQFKGVENAVENQTESSNMLIINYLKKNIVYPEKALNCNIEGTEVVAFTVTTEGNIKDFEIINCVCPEIDKEVILALEQTNGMWTPGVRDGQPAELPVEIPFTFFTSKCGHRSAQEVFTEKAIKQFSKGNQMLFEKGNTKKALHYYSKGLTYMPYDQSLLFARGICRFERGDKEGATKDWMRMRDLGGPDMSETTALMKGMTGYDEALAILKK